MQDRPFRIVIASHGPLADALVSAAGLILGSVAELHALALAEDEAPESLSARLRALVADGRATLVLTDLRGGSPDNVVVAAASDSVRAISGLNLAMLLEAVVSREPLTDALVERVTAAGRDGIVAARRPVETGTPPAAVPRA